MSEPLCPIPVKLQFCKFNICTVYILIPCIPTVCVYSRVYITVYTGSMIGTVPPLMRVNQNTAISLMLCGVWGGRAIYVLYLGTYQDVTRDMFSERPGYSTYRYMAALHTRPLCLISQLRQSLEDTVLYCTYLYLLRYPPAQGGVCPCQHHRHHSTALFASSSSSICRQALRLYQVLHI